ncbi:MAG TPA: MFS transporter [Patescibacteria group bacterium]|nr:MFS transporter [Patescibacteria group bacterium]
MNKVLRTLVLSDLFILSSFGLIQPIFAVFVLKIIPGATVSSVGLAIAIQLFTKALLQIIVGKWSDEEKGNCRELYTLIIGSLIISVVPLGYIFASSLAALYLIQFLYGMGQALSYPSWRVMFTRYTDRNRAGYEWGVYDTVVSFGTAAAAAIGAYLVEQYSFTHLFVFVAIMSFVGTTFLTHIFQQEFSCRIPTHKHSK